jgi:hypothetical protein
LVAPSQSLISIADRAELRYGRRALQGTKENFMSASLESILEAINKLPPNERQQLSEELAKKISLTEEERAAKHALVDRLFGSMKGLDRETIIKIAEDDEFCGY